MLSFSKIDLLNFFKATTYGRWFMVRKCRWTYLRFCTNWWRNNWYFNCKFFFIEILFLLVGNTTHRLFGACWGCDSSILKYLPTHNPHESTVMSENVAQLFFRMVGVLPVPPNDLSQLQAKNVLKEGPSQWVTVLVNNSRPPQKLMTYFTGLFFQKFANFWKSNTVKYRCVNFFYLP